MGGPVPVVVVGQGGSVVGGGSVVVAPGTVVDVLLLVTVVVLAGTTVVVGQGTTPPPGSGQSWWIEVVVVPPGRVVVVSVGCGPAHPNRSRRDVKARRAASLSPTLARIWRNRSQSRAWTIELADAPRPVGEPFAAVNPADDGIVHPTHRATAISTPRQGSRGLPELSCFAQDPLVPRSCISSPPAW